jgi:hypothetical protein
MSILKSSQKIQHFYHTYYRNVYQRVTNIKNEANTQKKSPNHKFELLYD